MPIKLDSVFFEIKADTAQFDAPVEQAKKTLKELQNAAATVSVNADVRGALAQIDSVKRGLNSVQERNANIKIKFEAALDALYGSVATAKKVIKDAGLDPNGDRPLIAKLEADITSFELKMKQALKLSVDFENDPHNLKLGLDAQRLIVGLKNAEAQSENIIDSLYQHQEKKAAAQLAVDAKVTQSVEANVRKRGLLETAAAQADDARTQQIGRRHAQAIIEDERRTEKAKANSERRAAATEKEARAMALAEIQAHKMNDALNAAPVDGFAQKAQNAIDAVQGVDLSLAGMARTAATALTNPVALAGIFTAAVAAIGTAAVASAAQFQSSFLGVRSTIDINAEQFKTLKAAMLDLSTETPRTAGALAEVAGVLARAGESDPKQLAEDVRLLALAGDALGAVDLKPLADTLDLIGDAFGLTAQQAREAFTQIVAITHGRIDLQEFGGVLQRSATRMDALGVSAQETAAAITTLIDAGVNSRNITTGLVDLLEKSGAAERKAVEAAAGAREGDAKAMRIFAQTVNESNIATKGVIGTLSDLFVALDKNQQKFEQAGLSFNDFQIAQKAFDATTAGATTRVLTYQESLDQLTKSATVNRDEAEQLVAVLKNKLAEELIKLGTVFLPPVITALRTLRDLFNETSKAASTAGTGIDEAAQAMVIAKKAAFRNDKPGEVAFQKTAIVRGLGAAQTIIDHPFSINDDDFDLNKAQNVLRVAQELQSTLSKDGEADPRFAKALKLIADRMKEVSTAGAPVVPTINRANDTFANTGQKAESAAKALESMLRSARETAREMGVTGNATANAQAKLQVLREEVDKLIVQLPKAKQAAARSEADTIFDQWADGIDRITANDFKKALDSVETFRQKLTGNAVTAISEEYERIVESLYDIAEAQDKLQTPGAAAVAKQARELADAFASQSKQLQTVAKMQVDYNNAIQLTAGYLQQGDAAYRGAFVSVKEYRAALQTIIETETAARVISQDATKDEKTRAAALQLANEAMERRKELERGGTEVRQQAADTNLLATALLLASENAAQLTKNLGDSGTGLARLAELGIRAAQIIKAVAAASAASQAAEASGKSQNAAQRLSAKSDWISLVIGGVLEIANGLDLFGTQAKKKAEELRKLSVEFNRSLEDFGRNVAEQGLSELAKAQNALARDVGKKLQEAAIASGLKGGENLGSNQSAASLRAYYEAIHDEIRNGRKRSKEELDALVDFANKVLALSNAAKAQEALLVQQHEAEVKRNTEDLGVRLLVAQGRDDEAAAMRRQLDQERELEQAKLDSTESGLAYYRALQEVIKAENAAATAVKRDPLKEFTNRAKLFGIEGEAYLTGLVGAYAQQFDKLNGLLDGIDVSTQGGLDALKARIQTIYAELEADGITEAEQKILDGLFNIFDTAVSVFNSLAEQVSRAFAKAAQDNDILGGNAQERFGRTSGAAKGFSAALDDILSNVDISTSAGATALQAQLRELYKTLSIGGIDAGEQVIVTMIQTLLGSITEVLDEGVANAEAQLEARAAERQAAKNKANRDIQINDLEGVDAFAVKLGGMAPGLRDLFTVFDVGTLGGVSDAKEELRSFFAELDTLSDEEIAERFGLTRAEITDALLEVDSSLDQLADTAETTAQSVLDLANAQREFSDSVRDDYLRAAGDNRTADINASKARTNQKLDRAKELGVPQSVIDEIIRTGELDIGNINSRYNKQEADAVASAAKEAASTATSVANDAKKNFITGSVQSTTYEQALRLIDYAASSLIELREIKIASVQMSALLSSLLSGAIPAVSVPTLPQGFGTGNGGGFQLIVQVLGPVIGMTPDDAGNQIAQVVLPILNRELYRSASIQAARTGGSLQ